MWGLTKTLGRGKRANREVGDLGEDLAARHLRARGHRVLARQWSNGRGEIDLITALRDGTVVFTEVKTRRGEAHGEPLEAVDEAKREQVMAVAQDYLRRWRIERRPVRYDLIGVTLGEGKPTLEHIEGIL